jgi:hypothetical protein
VREPCRPKFAPVRTLLDYPYRLPLFLVGGRRARCRRSHDRLGKVAALAKVSTGGARAEIAVAEMGPMPGTVISLRDTSVLASTPRDLLRDPRFSDFNPCIGAQFHLIVDDNGLDVARALCRDLTGQTVRYSGQVDGRVLVVEPSPLRPANRSNINRNMAWAASGSELAISSPRSGPKASPRVTAPWSNPTIFSEMSPDRVDQLDSLQQ